jgi:hypothetical protein
MIITNINNVLMTNADTLKTLGYLTAELDESRVPVTIKFLQDTKIQSVLGTQLFNLMLTQIESGIVETRLVNLLDSFIVSAIGYFIEAELTIPTSFKLRNKGVIASSDDKVADIDLKTIQYTIDWYNNRGEAYLANLVHYIDANTNIYPEWLQNGIGDKHPDKQPYKCNIYLDRSYSDNCRRPENP